MQRALNTIDCIWNRLLLKIDMIYLNMKKKNRIVSYAPLPIILIVEHFKLSQLSADRAP